MEDEVKLVKSEAGNIQLGRILESFMLHQEVFCFVCFFVNRNHGDDHDRMESNHR